MVHLLLSWWQLVSVTHELHFVVVDDVFPHALDVALFECLFSVIMIDGAILSNTAFDTLSDTTTVTGSTDTVDWCCDDMTGDAHPDT